MIWSRDARLRIRALLKKEFRQLLRDPMTARFVFGAPIVQLLMFSYAVSTDVHDLATYVVDYDRSYESRTLQDALTAGGYFDIIGRSDRTGDLQHAIDSGDASVGVVIPAGFARDLAAGRGAKVQIIVDGTSSNTATVAQGYATRIVNQFGMDYAQARSSLPSGGIDLRARAWYNPGLVSRVYNVPAVVGVLLLFMSLLLTALNVVRERELGTLEQLMVSPINGTELILGKIIPVTIIAFIDLIMITTLAVLWFHIPFRGSPIDLLIAASAFILCGLGFGLFLSTISRTQQEAFMSMFLIFLPMIILSGFMYPIRNMPWFFQKLTLLNPLRHFLEIVRGIFLKGEGIMDLLPQFAVITVSAVLVFWLATRRFKQRLE